MTGISSVSRSLSYQRATERKRTPTTDGKRRPGSDVRAILFVSAISVCLSLFVRPHPGEASINEQLYYGTYNVAIGWFVGFYLFDRAQRDGLTLFALRAACAILFGTLVNESIVEPVAFGTEPINAVGVYYGLTDSIWPTAIFFFLRIAEWRQCFQQDAHSELRRFSPPDTTSALSKSAEPDARCFFVRVGGGTRRIYAPHVLYMQAQRDFTRIVCANGEHFVSENLKSLVSKSANLGLVRVHRSFAVNLGRVDQLTRSEVQVGRCRIPVGRRYRPAFAEAWRSQSVCLSAH